MNRREFIKKTSASGLGLIGLISFPKILYNEFEKKLKPEYERLNEFEKIRLPVEFLSERDIAQKIKTNSEDILPFILKKTNIFTKKENKKEYLLRKVQTSFGEYAEELFIFDPYQMYLDEKNISPKTLITEGNYPKLRKRDIKKKKTLMPDKSRIISIFNKEYLIEFVALCYEKEPFKKNFYLLPMKNLKIKESFPFRNPVIMSPEGIYRGFSLELANLDTREKSYRLKEY